MTGPRRLVSSPVAQYLAIGLLALAAIVVATQTLAGRAARDEALDDARATTEVLALSVAEPALPRGLVAGRISAVDRFDRVALDRLLVEDVRRIKIWAEDGTILYSDEVRLIGDRFQLGPEELAILRDGGSEADVSDLGEPENRFEPPGEGLVEVYTQIVSPEGQPLLFETYFSADGIDARQAEVIAPFRRITIGGLVLLVAIATAMLWVMTRREARAAADRERLLRNAATASDAERRRIARDLHDGVVQDLAASAYAVATVARDASPEHRETLLTTARSLRSSMRGLRSLLVEIHPPDLSVTTLDAALQDLCAPAAAAGVEASVHVVPLDGVSQQSAALVWRVTQEAVRNALRHAAASSLRIEVLRTGDRVVLEVADDGRGFDPEAVREETRYGLRGLQSLAHDSGGVLEVRSSPGTGTTVRLEVGG
ncbi:ATP-binding protein [Nocardioides sp.]|uniref:sensor histidine kinase n=1 Tax=Nocardioides sp. TaxID=35761 RepID=UPI00286A6E3E|nr:ATP-binding protein [Nocardioides sp.]